MSQIEYLDSYEFQRRVSDFVHREVIYCVGSLIYELRSVAETLDDYDTYLELTGGVPDYEEAAREAGWDEIEGEIVKRPKFGEDYDIDDLVSYASCEHDCEVRIAERGPAGGVCTIDGVPAWQGYFNDEPVGDFYADKQDCWREIVDNYLHVFRQRYEKDFQDEADDWADACQISRLDPEYLEVYEHWIVSEYLGRKLTEQGQIVREYMGLTIWGRTCTGQAISMDNVIETIAAECLDIRLKEKEAA